MISYAQNFEDVMLWRALKNVKNGFYIDVGAFHPEEDSMTKWFYDQGWSGINIEPVKELHEIFMMNRQRDINLNCAIGNISKEDNLFCFPNSGLSTLNPRNAKNHLENHGTPYQRRKVAVRTLTDVYEKYASVNSIHFLNIDVETYERQVLEGIDFKKIRPWIIVIESTLPNSLTEDHKSWNHLLLEADYINVYFDGLNRFYLSIEHKELLHIFKRPPHNHFDEIINSNYIRIQNKLNHVEEQLQNLEKKNLSLIHENEIINSNYIKIQNKLDLVEEQFQNLKKENLSLIHENETVSEKLRIKFEDSRRTKVQYHSEQLKLNSIIQSLESSLSWKITAPLRFIFSKILQVENIILTPILKWVRKHEKLRVFLQYNLAKYPKFGKYLFSFAQKTPYPSTEKTVSSKYDLFHDMPFILLNLPPHDLERVRNNIYENCY